MCAALPRVRARPYPKPLEPPPLKPPLSLLPPPLQSLLLLDDLLQSLLEELLQSLLLDELPPESLLLEALRVCDGADVLSATAAPVNMLMKPALMLFKL